MKERSRKIMTTVLSFPNSSNDFKIIKALGGTTGAQLVTDSKGTFYVKKTGGTQGGNPN